MIYLKCECGSGLGVPGSFLNEPVRCDDCGRTLRLVAGQELGDRQAANWRLEVVAAPGGLMQGEHVLLGGPSPVGVGSSADKPLRLVGKFVSPDHCRFVPTDDGWILEDAGGPNGVFVNAERVTSAVLKAGDALRIGGYELRYAAAGRPAPAARPRPTSAPAVAPPPQPPPPPPPPPPTRTPVPTPSDGAATDYQVEYDLAEPPPAPPRLPRSDFGTLSLAPPAVPATSLVPAGPPCPCCGRRLAAGARICVDCGIDIRTGRPLLTAQGLDEDALHVHAETTARVVSWVIPLGVYPIGSEARGNVKPYAVWSIAALTVLVSLVWFAFLWSAPEGMHPSGSQLMLWAGSQPAAEERSAELLEMIDEAEEAGELEAGEATDLREVAGQATLPFEPYQVLTHALLHDGILHLAGNLLFLLVLGTRVNALIGNAKTAIIYPILAVAGGVAHMIASRDEPATPMLGASGAIMGLAGMYLVLFPAYRVHMAAWIRLFIFVFGVTIFAVRGFWVVLFYIAFDVVAAALRAESGVAHWAHLGGFMAGVATALLLLLTRNVHAHGGDILSVALGRRAWPLLGRPTSYRSPNPAAAEVTSPAA